MILICEPQCWGFEHARVNAGLISIVSNAFPHEDTTFLAEREHLEIVEKILKEHSIAIDGDEIALPPHFPLNAANFPSHVLLYRRILQHAAAVNAKMVIFSSITAPGLVSLKVLLPMFRRTRCIIGTS